MLKAYKYRLYPSAAQCKKLAQVFGNVRLVYNLALETRNTAYQSGVKLSGYDIKAQIPNLKSEFPWIAEAPSQALQCAVFDMDRAFLNFFRGRARFPRFKSKDCKQAFRLPQGVKYNFEESFVKLPKLGKVKTIFSRTFSGKLKSCTVSKTPTGKYFISMLVDTEKDKPSKKSVKKKTAVGIDLGIKSFAVTSDGEVFESQKYFTKLQPILRREQRKLARCKKGSNRRAKQKLHVAKLHERIANQRADFLHKLSTRLIRKYDTIAVEDLNVSGMLKNRRLAKHIGDSGWRAFRTMLEYKADWYGKNVEVVDRWHPSSKTCSRCGNKHAELTLAERQWDCPSCGSTLERDVNAAVNIKNYIFNARDGAIGREVQAVA